MGYKIIYRKIKENDPIEVPDIEECEDGPYTDIEAYIILSQLYNEWQGKINEMIYQLEMVRGSLGKVMNVWDFIYKRASYNDYKEAYDRIQNGKHIHNEETDNS